ncbi:unnamed protein product, partial [Lampetra fluviatilis]
MPTTGFIAVLAALHTCPDVSIAGFGYPANSPGALVHYYGNSRMHEITKENIHSVSPEWSLLQQLTELGHLTNLTPV